MNKVRNYLQQNLFSIISLFLMMSFYLFFAICDGAIIAVDSPSYIEMSFSREPFYPLLLAVFRRLYPENYLLYVVIFQSLLMAVSGWYLAHYLIKKWKLPKWHGILLYFMPIAVSLLNRFLAKRSSMYTNNILTEGICTSLYLLFIAFILGFCLDSCKKKIVLSWILMFIMFTSRKQMLMTLPIFLFALLYQAYEKKQLKKGILTAFISSLLLIFSFSLFDSTYNYLLRGSFEGHSSSNRFVSTIVFYHADRADADYIEDSHIKELFLEIYDVCDEKGALSYQANEGWMNRVAHFGDYYDIIQIDTMWPMILQDARDHINEEYQSMDMSEEELSLLYDMESDRINSIIIHSVLPHQIPEIAGLLMDNFLSGLVITLAQLRSIFIPYTIFMFLFYFGFTIFIAGKNLSSKTMTEEFTTNKNSVLFSVITLIGIFSNTLVVSSVIFCQTRYMIYNMPLFYMTICILFYQVCRNIKLKTN